jgi:hypothetical protein
MKKILLVLGIFLLIGCSEFSPAGEKFVVKRFESWGDTSSRYLVTSIKGEAMFWMISEKRYKKGDTLTLK